MWQKVAGSAFCLITSAAIANVQPTLSLRSEAQLSDGAFSSVLGMNAQLDWQYQARKTDLQTVSAIDMSVQVPDPELSTTLLTNTALTHQLLPRLSATAGVQRKQLTELDLGGGELLTTLNGGLGLQLTRSLLVNRSLNVSASGNWQETVDNGFDDAEYSETLGASYTGSRLLKSTALITTSASAQWVDTQQSLYSASLGWAKGTTRAQWVLSAGASYAEDTEDNVNSLSAIGSVSYIKPVNPDLQWSATASQSRSQASELLAISELALDIEIDSLVDATTLGITVDKASLNSRLNTALAYQWVYSSTVFDAVETQTNDEWVDAGSLSMSYQTTRESTLNASLAFSLLTGTAALVGSTQWDRQLDRYWQSYAGASFSQTTDSSYRFYVGLRFTPIGAAQ